MEQFDHDHSCETNQRRRLQRSLQLTHPLLDKSLQESCAIAMMTAQCALHMGALKIFGTL